MKIFRDGVEVELSPEEEAALIASFPPAVPTAADYSAPVQAMLDAKAQERRYDSIASAVSYVTSTVPNWSAEAIALRDWRDAVWSYALAQLAAAQAGECEAPTVEGFLDEVASACPFTWP